MTMHKTGPDALRVAAVVGPREYTREQIVEAALSACAEQLGVRKIVTGGSKGLDRYAAKAADTLNLELEEIRRDWDKRYGRKNASSVRARALLENADCLIAFRGNMRVDVARMEAHARGIPVYRVSNKPGEPFIAREHRNNAMETLVEWAA